MYDGGSKLVDGALIGRQLRLGGVDGGEVVGVLLLGGCLHLQLVVEIELRASAWTR